LEKVHLYRERIALMDKIIRYIKKLEKKYDNVEVRVTINNVKVIYGFFGNTIDVMTIEEFEEKCGK
jgi:hypothetical protein